MNRIVESTDWVAAAEQTPVDDWLVLRASWSSVEPQRGAYDDGVLEAGRRALIVARKRGMRVVLVTHSGALPDWQIARDGWLDPDCLAGYGCFVDQLAHRWGELARHWVGLWCPLGEAACYEADQRRVARTLLDAQSSAWLHLRKAPGPGGQGTLVGVAERFDVAPTGLGGRLRERLFDRPAHALTQVLATGQLAPPFAPVGELPNGTPAMDFAVLIKPTAADIHRVWATGRSVFVVEGPADEVAREGVRVLGQR